MRRTVTIAVLLIIASPSFSQDTLSYAEQLKAIEDEMDSLSIFNLIDSLFTLDLAPSSELNIRFGYTTNVTSAGRDYNISQSGISPGISYYHKSGFYGDLAGYWNSGVDPNYNPTILSTGYLGSFQNPKWSYSIDAEKWFYNPKDSSENPLTYSVGGALSYDFKWGFASVDYSFLFGEETANRIITNLSSNIDLGKWWIFKSITLYPTVNMMMGNSDITQLRISNRQISDQNAARIQRLTTFANLTGEQKKYVGTLIIKAYRNGTITEEVRNQLLTDLKFSSELSTQDQQALQQIVNEGYEVTEYVDANGFGILNYSFTLPFSLSTDRWYFMISYTYSIPVQLPGEFIEVDPIGYFGASISYRIPFK
ncbi:hypothetical protein [Ekhidna sp.]|jgi:hypothetical protein|uniref:hypothetical protein n=1 Tax=Ekhidna sp. TaxID=2608089 RepID=UPI0032EDB7E2